MTQRVPGAAVEAKRLTLARAGTWAFYYETHTTMSPQALRDCLQAMDALQQLSADLELSAAFATARQPYLDFIEAWPLLGTTARLRAVAVADQDLARLQAWADDYRRPEKEQRT